MKKSLGVFVSSNQHMNKLLKLCGAAKKKGIEVTIFFTHFGALLTQDRRFEELKATAKLSLCSVSFENQGLRSLPGLEAKDLATQARHAELIEACERYVVF